MNSNPDTTPVAPLKSYAAFSEKSRELLGILQTVFASSLDAGMVVGVDRHDVVMTLPREKLLTTMEQLKVDPMLLFSMLVDVTATDYMDSRPERFEMVYHLMSIKFGYRLRVKAVVPERDAKIDSLTNLWKSALFQERETWDMYGIEFRGHPDLRRLLMYEEFVGHPLRKDYPVQAKQPRIKMRAPEVRNTAVDMRRPDLVQIKRGAK